MVPSLSSLLHKLSKSKNSIHDRRPRSCSVESSSVKSVHFQDFVETYESYSSTEYDRRPSEELDEYHAPSFVPCTVIEEYDDERDPDYLKLVEKNTRINQKLGHHSLAVLISYRSYR
ncbi:hypothetical protein INT43_000346 [Umbelopsis isabellina]|uniref:Uncharacterized protein n=1 Tax=Mortierella isabellina TaxID=91625 RepID=A0A8H7Q1L3_MORIS|nr:hypothetical protein INT43_000346 [Umbelopsis isabellina]